MEIEQKNFRTFNNKNIRIFVFVLIQLFCFVLSFVVHGQQSVVSCRWTSVLSFALVVRSSCLSFFAICRIHHGCCRWRSTVWYVRKSDPKEEILMMLSPWRNCSENQRNGWRPQWSTPTTRNAWNGDGHRTVKSQRETIKSILFRLWWYDQWSINFESCLVFEEYTAMQYERDYYEELNEALFRCLELNEGATILESSLMHLMNLQKLLKRKCRQKRKKPMEMQEPTSSKSSDETKPTDDRCRWYSEPRTPIENDDENATNAKFWKKVFEIIWIRKNWVEKVRKKIRGWGSFAGMFTTMQIKSWTPKAIPKAKIISTRDNWQLTINLGSGSFLIHMIRPFSLRGHP